MNLSLHYLNRLNLSLLVCHLYVNPPPLWLITKLIYLLSSMKNNFLFHESFCSMINIDKYKACRVNPRDIGWLLTLLGVSLSFNLVTHTYIYVCVHESVRTCVCAYLYMFTSFSLHDELCIDHEFNKAHINFDNKYLRCKN